ncbi:MAG: hypothetical protein QNJ36_07125 [Calothrix sp. MO_167.B42]|nr:hypothetical protein [Calothrix sp. MO_167.B42]
MLWKPLRVAPFALCRKTRPPQWLTVHRTGLPPNALAPQALTLGMPYPSSPPHQLCWVGGVWGVWEVWGEKNFFFSLLTWHSSLGGVLVGLLQILLESITVRLALM